MEPQQLEDAAVERGGAGGLGAVGDDHQAVLQVRRLLWLL